MNIDNNNTISPDMVGHTAPTPPDTAGHGAPQPTMSQSDAVTTPGQSPTSPDMPGAAPGYMTLDDVTLLFEKAGIIRARRTFQRYCETGMLQGQKFDTLNGPQYFVLASSVPRAIESVKALEASRTRPVTTGERQPQPAMSEPTPPPTPQPVAPAAPPSQPSTHLDPAMARYVERLEHDLDRAEAENDNKTAIINSLIERDRETNSLTQGLQKLLTPLLGRVYGQDFLGLDSKADAANPKP